MKLRRPVKVYAILTENLRQGLLQELQQQLQQIERTLDELAWQRRRLEAEAPTPQTTETLQHLEQERRRGLEARQKLVERSREMLSQPLGVEMLHSTVEAEIEVAVGDLWEQRINPVIILEDGRVVAIRGVEGGDR